MNVNGRIYHFTCDMDAPLQDAKEAMFGVMKYLGQIEDQIKAIQAQKDAEKDQSAQVENVNPS